MADPLVASIEKQEDQIFSHSSMAAVVTYCYYRGMLALMKNSTNVAYEKLSMAYRNCHRSAVRNQRARAACAPPARRAGWREYALWRGAHRHVPVCTHTQGVSCSA